MELPLEEGYVYGRTPKEPSKPPDIHAVFEAVGVPKGKLGELPYPKEWYDGAKERARLRAIELDELYVKKNEIRQEWVRLALAEGDFHIEQVDQRLVENGPVLGLAELLARAAQERPEDEERIERLEVRATKAVEDQERLRSALAAARDHLTTSATAIRKREVEDCAAETERLEEKRAAEARKRKGQKILARQAALLRGEEVPPSSDEESAVEEPGDRDAAGVAAAAQDSLDEGQLAGAAQPAPPSFLSVRAASPSPHPSPELRGGPARQLPPLLPLPGVVGAGGSSGGSAAASPTKQPRGPGLPRSPFQSPK